MQDQSGISVDAQGNGDGGNISINTDNLVLFDDSNIIANAETGRGGNILIRTKVLFPFGVEDNQIYASSDKGIDGEIRIFAPDFESKINPNLQESKPIAVENLIYTGCGLNSDFVNNRFRYLGRGGISPSPLNTITEDIMSELGTVEYIQKTRKIEPKNSIETSVIPTRNYNSPSPRKLSSQKNLKFQEATTWIVNDRGNVELVAESSNVPMSASECPMDF